MALTLSGMALATGKFRLRFSRQNPRLAPCGSPHLMQSECHSNELLNEPFERKSIRSLWPVLYAADLRILGSVASFQKLVE